MNVIATFLITVLVFGVLIFVHEGGHFLAGRIFGVKINEFAIGMGPKIWSKTSKKTGTLYSIRVLPIGGYNAMEGEQEESDEDGAFCSKPVWQRMIIIVAGATMNLILGFLLMAVVVLMTEHYASTTVHSFKTAEGEPEITEYQGLQVGDEILSVNGHSVHIGNEVAYRITYDGAEPLTVTVRRNGETVTVENISFPTATSSGFTYGVQNFYVYAEQKSFVNTVKQTFYGCTNSLALVYDSLGGLLSGKFGLEQLSGPIGVGEAIGSTLQEAESTKEGLNMVLNLAALLSINLGIFNLLPFPALDGGRFVFLMIEGIRKKPLPGKVEPIINTIGMVILLTLVGFIAVKDIFVLFR